MLAKMSVNDDIGQHGIMEQIYNIGNPVNPKGTNVVDNHFSMMQQMQGVGLAIIKQPYQAYLVFIILLKENV